MPARIELVSIRYENVRGFYDTTLPLKNEKTLIVGRNHAGKTSALLLLAWLINDADPNRLFRNEVLDPDERNLLLPARDARHRARRITLTVYIPDGRIARGFESENKISTLRIGFRVTGAARAFIQLGKATRKSGDKSDSRAKKLLSEIQNTFSVVHIPAARDAASQQFQNRFKDLFVNTLSERALHSGKQSGATTEYREIANTIVSLKDLAGSQLNPMLENLAKSVPTGLLKYPKLDFKENTVNESLVNWIVDQILLKFVTGDHDNSGVPASDVGAGLQSVLDIAAASVILQESQEKLVIAVEEPESFLHPSVQRIVARRLLSEEYGHKTLVSTHSPILVEEAKYENILLAAERKFLLPKQDYDAKRLAINTALLTGQGAEMVFAASVLLVEGPGDREFFEGIRRRVAKGDSSGRVDDLFVTQVGGKSNFAPWIKLLHGLNGGDVGGAISYVVAPDGDAIQEAQAAFGECSVRIPGVVSSRLGDAHQEFSRNNYSEWRTKLNEANSILSESSAVVPLCFLEGDLEYAMFSNLSGPECKEWADFWGIEFGSKNEFVKRLGSKAIDGSGGKEHKKPYMRKQFAEKVSISKLSTSIQLVLEKWLVNTGFNLEDAKDL